MRRAVLAILVSALASEATAQTAGEIDLRPFDRNHSGSIDTPEEGRILGLHRVNATLAKYDQDYDGLLSDAEARALQRDVARLSSPDAGEVLTPAELAVLGAAQAEAAAGTGTQISTVSADPVPARERCTNTSAWFVRHDRLELSPYSQAIGPEEAKGASVALTNDDLADAESVEVHGVVARAFTRTCNPPPNAPPGTAYLSGYTVAGYLQADGLRTDIDPTKDESLVRLGADFQWGVFGGPMFNSQYVTLSPYLQTDLRGGRRDCRPAGLVGAVSAAISPWRNVHSHRGGL